MKTWEIIFSGVGGQGLIFSGTLMGSAATIVENHYAVLTSSYGVETRGTFTKSDLILSDEPIDFPEVQRPDVVVALAQVAYKKYCMELEKDSILIFNSDCIEKVESKAKQLAVPMDMLSSSAENPFPINIVALGIVTAVTGAIRPASIVETIKAQFKDNQRVCDTNLAAFLAGLNATKGIGGIV